MSDAAAPQTEHPPAARATSRRHWRWLTPLIALAIFASLGGIVSALANSADAALKPRPVSQLLLDVENARVDGFSGTIVQTSNLGLPSLPDLGGGSDSGLTSLLTGTNTLRVWHGNGGQVRLALLSEFGETDLIRNGANLWQWNSSSKSATHWTLPKKADHNGPMTAPPTPLTPQRAAREALREASGSTAVTSGGTTTVAGRKAYLLVLTPRTHRTLVSSVQIAIDGATHLPTRVQVFARGSSSPAFQVGFTSFDTGSQPASVFGFNPPPGTKVTRTSLGDLPSSLAHADHSPRKGQKSQKSTTVVGSGWSSVLVSSDPGLQKEIGAKGELGAVLGKLPVVSGSWGSGHLFAGTLFSAVITNDGRVAIGAVPPSVLTAALGRR